MRNTAKPKLIIHFDVDSPIKLLDFYQIKDVKFDQKALELFYETSFNRAFAFFKKHKLKATFFVVGDELESSDAVQKIIYKAHSLGHEIENHSYSHPFGLATLGDGEIEYEIQKCSEIIYKITGVSPVGFRSPGYSINTKIINILKNNGFRYDSSGFWSVLNPILEYGHKLLFKNGLKNEGFGYVTSKISHEPYLTSNDNWLLKSKTESGFWEIPLPRTKLFGLPFYNNINLWTPKVYSFLISKSIKRKQMVYLFHAIEFMDLNDGLPAELIIHPNLKTPLSIKLKRSDKTIQNLLKRYEPVTTRQLLNSFSGK